MEIQNKTKLLTAKIKLKLQTKLKNMLDVQAYCRHSYSNMLKQLQNYVTIEIQCSQSNKRPLNKSGAKMTKVQGVDFS